MISASELSDTIVHQANLIRQLSQQCSEMQRVMQQQQTAHALQLKEREAELQQVRAYVNGQPA